MLPSAETIETNRRFDGFRTTPFLWKGILDGLEMYEGLTSEKTVYPVIDSKKHIRLGKLTEQFVLFELEQESSVKLLNANIQVKHNKITIGELDCLIEQVEQNIHLEIIYKFYLYDPNISTELHRWIGPNRNDSFIQKINKLKEKQLPLFYHPETRKLLHKLSTKLDKFKQMVHFKAQLFVPFNFPFSNLPFVNQTCIKGFYIRTQDLTLFKDHTFFIPTKLDWLVEPFTEADWVSIILFKEQVSNFLTNKRAPLCWMKSVQGEMKKFFIVWW